VSGCNIRDPYFSDPVDNTELQTVICTY